MADAGIPNCISILQGTSVNCEEQDNNWTGSNFIGKGASSEAPCSDGTLGSDHGEQFSVGSDGCVGQAHSAGEVLDGDGVSSETPWTNSLTDGRSIGPQHMGSNKVNEERVHGDMHNDGLLTNWEATHSGESSRTIRGKYTGNSGGVGKHGRRASPIAEKPPWH